MGSSRRSTGFEQYAQHRPSNVDPIAVSQAKDQEEDEEEEDVGSQTFMLVRRDSHRLEHLSDMEQASGSATGATATGGGASAMGGPTGVMKSGALGVKLSADDIFNKKFRLLLAGGLAGAVAKTVVAPFERVKLLCQAGSSVGMMATFRNVARMEGLKGFWRGNYANCVRIVPNKGVLFGCTDMYKDFFRKLSNTPAGAHLSSWYSVAAGSFAGLTAVSVSYPLDFVRMRMAGSLGEETRYTGIYRTLVLTVREEGLWALYRGVGPTLLGALPYEGVKFGSYDLLTRTFVPASSKEDPSTRLALQMCCGAAAGMMATITTYPNDTIRRRMQMQGAGGAERKYKTSLDCWRIMVKEEGVTALYRGLTPTMGRAVPNMGVQFMMYEAFKNLFGVSK